MPRGRTIKLYVMSNDFNHLKTVELSNWTGKAYIGERKHTKLIQNIHELSVPGVYFLITQENEEYQKTIYIGEADEVNKRIQNHSQQKDWWDTFVIFINKDANLTKAHVRFLEKKLYFLSLENKTTIKLTNSSEPSGSKLPKSDIDDMDEYLDNVIFVLKNLGIIDFTKTFSDKPINKIDNNEIFELNLTSDRKDENNNILKAKLIIIPNGYRLLKGSYIEKIERQSFSKQTYYKLRKQLENNKNFDNSNYEGCYVLNCDIDFSSSSAAASIVKNRATNGPKEWKLKNGITLDEFEMQVLTKNNEM